MRLSNDEGNPVDAVPFLVSLTGSFLMLFAFGPGYLLGLGLQLGEAMLVVAGVFCCSAGLSYYLFVRRARPEQRAQIPGPVRFKRLYYAVLIGIALIVLLMLPFYV